jgi:hypothetical protein
MPSKMPTGMRELVPPERVQIEHEDNSKAT